MKNKFFKKLRRYDDSNYFEYKRPFSLKEMNKFFKKFCNHHSSFDLSIDEHVFHYTFYNNKGIKRAYLRITKHESIENINDYFSFKYSHCYYYKFSKNTKKIYSFGFDCFKIFLKKEFELTEDVLKSLKTSWRKCIIK